MTTLTIAEDNTLTIEDLLKEGLQNKEILSFSHEKSVDTTNYIEIFSNFSLATAFIGLAVFIFIILLPKRSFNSKRASEEFFGLLDQKFELGLIKNKSDITILAESHKRDQLASYELIPLLEDYLTYTVKRAKEGGKKKNAVNTYTKVKAILDEEMKDKPFSDMPEEEGRLLRSLKDSIDHKAQASAYENLDDLKMLISARNKIYSRSSKLNRWSVPLAIFGLIATLIFGFMSFLNRVNYDKILELAEKGIQIESIKD